jgi:DNA-binding response OmpR family regulator
MTDHSLKGHHVLVVEDEPLIALDLEAALHDIGAQVIGPAGTLERALALANSESLTAAIVDLRLHGRSAREVVVRLVERAVPFIFYSGHLETPTARDLASVPIIFKPASSAQVVATLARVVTAANGGLIKSPS